MVWKCLLCEVEYEPPKSRRLVCAECSEKVLNMPPQLVPLRERLWGKCYEKDQCWEYGSPRHDGRPSLIMAAKRQHPPAHIALDLSGSPRPSPLHAVYARCLNKMCVRPEHLEWKERATVAGPLWAHALSRDEILAVIQRQREANAKYRRDHRAKLRRLGARTIGEHLGRALVARAPVEVEALSEAPGVVVQDAPEPPWLAIVPPAAPPAAPAPVAAPAVKPAGLWR